MELLFNDEVKTGKFNDQYIVVLSTWTFIHDTLTSVTKGFPNLNLPNDPNIPNFHLN